MSASRREHGGEHRSGLLPTARQALTLLTLLVVAAGGVIALTSMLHFLTSLRDH